VKSLYLDNKVPGEYLPLQVIRNNKEPGELLPVVKDVIGF